MKTPSIPLAWSLRESWRKGYHLSDFFSDLKSGLTVGIVAIPLSMALAISSGVSPQHGLYTVIIAGTLTALLGGSRFQVTGPTAAFVVLLVPIVHQFGLIGLLTAGFLSGLMLLLFGLVRLGGFIKFIPHPVTTGFTTGIALVIAVIQFQDFFGLKINGTPEDFPDRLYLLAKAFPHFSGQETAMGFFTLLLLMVFLKIFRRIPAPLAAILICSVIVVVLKKLGGDAISIETINSKFHYHSAGVSQSGIPPFLPTFDLHNINLNYSYLKKLLNASFSIALLGAIESLLSAVVADGMTKTRHNPNAELIALGISNMLCPFFGGIPATGALARTATNIRFGAKSAISAVVHGIVTLIVLVSLAPMMGYIPMASLAGILLLVAYNMSEKHHFINIIRYAERDDRLVLLLCFFFTVTFDMTVGIGLGMVLASILFIRRVAKLAKIELMNPIMEQDTTGDQSFPKDLFFFRISGPLFFGAAERAISTMLSETNGEVKAVLLDGENIDLVDATGMTALYSAISELLQAGKIVILVTTHPTMLKILEKGAPQVYYHPNFRKTGSVEEGMTVYRKSTTGLSS